MNKIRVIRCPFCETDLWNSLENSLIGDVHIQAETHGQHVEVKVGWIDRPDTIVMKLDHQCTELGK